MPHGEGTEKQSNNVKFTGTYVNGIQNGIGKMTFPDGSEYEGEFTEGKRSNRGKLTTADGDVYEGEFNDN